jgi:uncharacterized lipoprotein YbaY
MTATTGATAGLMLALVAWQGHAAEQVTGTATYRERIALPPDAVFEATLEDVSKADAPAEVIGRARVESPGNPPIQFEIPYDPARIDERHRYAVRARIVVAGKPFLITEHIQDRTTAPRPVRRRGQACGKLRSADSAAVEDLVVSRS